jgi:hypothetical protein
MNPLLHTFVKVFSPNTYHVVIIIAFVVFFSVPTIALAISSVPQSRPVNPTFVCAGSTNGVCASPSSLKTAPNSDSRYPETMTPTLPDQQNVRQAQTVPNLFPTNTPSVAGSNQPVEVEVAAQKSTMGHKKGPGHGGLFFKLMKLLEELLHLIVKLPGSTPGGTPTPTVFPTISVTPTTPVTKTLSGCQEITTSGNYTLTQDITVTFGEDIAVGSPSACLNFHDTSDVSLDCNNHKITVNDPPDLKGHYIVNPGVRTMNVQNFSLNHCKLENTGFYASLDINKTTGGTIQNVTVNHSPVYVNDSQKMHILSNTLAYYQQRRSTGMVIQNNSIKNDPLKTTQNIVVMDSGSHNTISGNTIDGSSSGIYDANTNDSGADSGIQLDNESFDQVENNKIFNFYNNGIETGGYVHNTRMFNNTITNTGRCGIGGWHNNSWSDNTVENNTITSSPELFQFFRVEANQTANFVYFKDNTFSGNKLINQQPVKGDRNTLNSASFYFSLEPTAYRMEDGTYIPTANIQILNNKFTGNDFGKITDAPYFAPASMAIDGGGNICKQPSLNPNPLKCN